MKNCMRPIKTIIFIFMIYSYTQNRLQMLNLNQV